MFRTIQCAALAVACLSILQPLHAQNAVIRTARLPDHPVRVVTPFGDTNASVSRLDSSPNLLIAIAKDTLSSDDYPEIRRLIASLYKTLHADTIVRIAVIHAGLGIDIAGPFRNPSELQTLLRNTTPDTDSPTLRDAAVFIPLLAGELDRDPPLWGATLILGRIPDFPPTLNPSVSQYAAAWLTRKSVAQKRTLLFRDISGSPLPQWAVFATQATGGMVFAARDDPAAFLAHPAQLAAVSWETPRPSVGFDLQMASLQGFDEYPNLALPSVPGKSTLPDPAAYIELTKLIEALKTAPAGTDPAALKASLDRALAINPADRDIVTIGLNFANTHNDPEGEIDLLRTAVELTPNDAALWTRLGNLHFARKDFAASEPSLLRARTLGAKDARSAEQLGRIGLNRSDLPHAADYIDESLALDPAQQALWFLAADLAKDLGRLPRRTEALERALALGGSYVDRRVELIRVYLAAGDRANAARHADLELPNLPPDPDIQSTWADFYEKLARPDDALACWQRVVAADPRRKDASYAGSAILFEQHRYPAALEAAEHGLEVDASSARLELVKVNSLERLARIYELRRSLDEFSPESADIAIMARRAEIADVYGGDAPAAWRRYAEALIGSAAPKADLDRALARGWRVCLREGDLTAAAWFEARVLPPRKEPQPASPLESPVAKNGIWIPGGFEALAFMAHAAPGARPAAFLVEYSRTLIANFSSGSEKEHELYRKAISGYFEQLKQLIALSTRTPDRAVLTLSVSSKQSQSQTETVLNIFGWKLRRQNRQLTVESGEKSGQSQKQDLAAALNIDQSAMQQAFQAGQPFRIEIPFEWAPVVLDDAAWRTTAQSDRYTGGLAEAMSQRPEIARVYLGLSNVDKASASVLAYDIGLQLLLTKYDHLLALYSPALSIAGGRVVVPGGTAAEPIWSKLCGASPADPARFYRALFDKDAGKMLAWFFALSQLDPAHQRFFTRTEKRTADFYEAFSNSADLRTGASNMLRDGTFSAFLREIPLDGESVDFPGSPEVWMVAQGRSKANRQTARLLQKVRKAAAPELEDQILLRLARTINKADNDSSSEIDNFLAVAHIEMQRRSGSPNGEGEGEGLDDESALLLAQNYNEFASFYPYFTAFRELNSADFNTLFEFFGRMRTADIADTDLILGQFYALTELIRLAMEPGGMPEARANQIFRDLCKRFLAATDVAAITSAALDTLRDLTAGASTDTDRSLRTAILGGGPPLDLEWQGKILQLDPAHDRERAFGRVLDLQKVPPVTLLLRLDESTRRIAAGASPLPDAIASLEKDAVSLPSVEIPKTLKLDGHAKASLLRASPARIPLLVAELRQKATKRKVNPDDIRKLCHEILAELAPQVRIALIGAVYAAYLSPDNLLIADDPLLVRKHQAFELQASSFKKNRFLNSGLNPDSAREGSFFEGGFAHFAVEAARAGSPSASPAAWLYANQIAAIHTTPWLKYRDEDQRLLGLRLRVAREWFVYAADDPALLQDLSEGTLGILSLTRRRLLLNGIAARSWDSVWSSVTVSDLLFLSDRYAARYAKCPWNSPVDIALRQAGTLSDGSSLRSLGALPVKLYGSSHPDRVLLAPYEEYERHLLPGDMAERAAEMKLYLAAVLDRNALPAALMPCIAEPVAKLAFGAMRLSDSKDWNSAMKAFSAIDEKTIGKAIEANK